MEEEKLKRRVPNISITADITEKEIDTIEAPYEFKIGRTKTKLIDKTKTPLYELEDIFISYQRGKNNTEQTIKYYQKVFRNIYRFLVYECSSVESYKRILDSSKIKDEATLGSILPIMALEIDDFDSLYKEYILGVLGNSEQTMNNLFRGYRAIAYFAMDRGWIEKRTIHIKDIEPPIRNVYTQEEINKLLKRPNFDDFVEYRDWVIIQYLLATGNRISSIANLKVGDIDLNEGFVNVNYQKNRQPIRIALTRSIMAILREYINNYRCDDDGYPLIREYLFCTVYGKRCDPVALGQSLAAYNKAHGVAKTSTHLWRHTFAKNWIVTGGDILSLQKMLGHKSLTMVKRYANLYSVDLKPKVEEHAAINTIKTKSGQRKLTRRK